MSIFEESEKQSQKRDSGSNISLSAFKELFSNFANLTKNSL